MLSKGAGGGDYKKDNQLFHLSVDTLTLAWTSIDIRVQWLTSAITERQYVTNIATSDEEERLVPRGPPIDPDV